MRQRRFWRVAMICLVAVVLAACGNRSLDKSVAFTTADPDGMIVLGIVRNIGDSGPVMMGRFDPATGRFSGLSMLPGDTLKANSDGMAVYSKDRFVAYRLPPGEYGIGLIQSVTSGRSGTGTQIRNTWLLDRETMTVRDNTPVFTVKPGELIYIGDLIIDPPVGIKVGADRAAMQKFLAEFGAVNAVPKYAPLRPYQAP